MVIDGRSLKVRGRASVSQAQMVVLALITLQGRLQTKNLPKPNKLCHRVLVLFYVCFCVIYASVYLISKQMYFITKQGTDRCATGWLVLFCL